MHTCALSLLPALNRRLIKRDADPRGRGQRQHTVLQAQACLWRDEALEIVDILLQHKVFHGETVRHRGHQMDVYIGMPVGATGRLNEAAVCATLSHSVMPSRKCLRQATRPERSPRLRAAALRSAGISGGAAKGRAIAWLANSNLMICSCSGFFTRSVANGTAAISGSFLSEPSHGAALCCAARYPGRSQGGIDRGFADFLGEAQKLNFEIHPVTAATIDALLAEVYATPKDVLARAAKAISSAGQ